MSEDLTDTKKVNEISIYGPIKIFDVRKRLHLEFDRNGYLEEYVRGKSVLHVGCSDWPITEERIQNGTLLHLRLQRTAKELIGIDLSELGIAVLRKYQIDNVTVMNAESMHLNKRFDLILAGDVLEHMNNPGSFLQKAVSLLNSNGEIVVGVPSALTINSIKVWLGGSEQVHSDHTFYFSPKTLSSLFGRFDLLPVKLVFTVQPPGSYESQAFLTIRRFLLTLVKKMSPSIIMHFKKTEDTERSQYIEWA